MMKKHAFVYGATGHTGRMVAEALHSRGWTLTLSGRRRPALESMATALDATVRPASIESPTELDQAINGCSILINCAGPFRDTAPPLIAAALRQQIPYLDVAAEIETILDTMQNWDTPAREAGALVIPAVGFYGGLGALVAAEAVGAWDEADRIVLSYGLNEWIPTAGTLVAGAVSRERRNGGRPIFIEGALAYTSEPAPIVEWDFPAPIGRQPAVSELTMADTVTIARQVRVQEIVSYMPEKAIADLDGGTVRPSGDAKVQPSHQRFVLQATAFRGEMVRSCTVRGGDIYAITAPLVAEAAEFAIRSTSGGIRVAAELGAPGELLRTLIPYLDIESGQPAARDRV
jgi:NAD(P)-dependent dehydrogenase (short-subunit alcohol dehydrogenase family)